MPHNKEKKAELETKKQKARELLVSSILTQKRVAEIVGVSERTLSNWSQDNNWQGITAKGIAIRELQERARFLIVFVGYSQKEAGAILSVSEKTISKWAKLFKWKSDEENYLKKLGGLTSVINGFFDHWDAQHGPTSGKRVRREWDNYLLKISPEIGKNGVKLPS